MTEHRSVTGPPTCWSVVKAMVKSDRVAIVTGASSGIGRSLGQELARSGYHVGLTARRASELERLAQEITERGGVAQFAAADVGQRDDIHRAIRTLSERLGPVDLLIANAGVGVPTLLDPLNVADVEATFRVNVLGVAYCIEAVLPTMLNRGSGHLVAISSLAAYKGLPGESAYCASKAAVNAYLEGLRIQLCDRGVRVTTVCPGFVHTPMTAANDFAMPWVLTADEAARRIVRAIARRQRVFNFPWPAYLACKLTSRLPDWVVARAMRRYNANPPMPVSHDGPGVH